MADIVRPGESADGPIGWTPDNLDIKWVHGDRVKFYALIQDENNVSINLTGYTPKAQIKTDYDETVVGEFDLTITGVAGQVLFYISSADSALIDVGSYIYDFQLTDPSGDVLTYLTGDISVLQEVTT